VVPTAGAVAGALYSYDRIRRTKLPMDDASAAAPSVSKSRKKNSAPKPAYIPPSPGGSSIQPALGDD
jgi:hypothetical protein